MVYKMPAVNETLRRSFEDKYIPEPNSGCWLWTAAVSRLGYGKIGFRGRGYVATRISLAIAGRPPHPRQFALHTCDNPYCVNPDHLFIGSQKDNMRDMHRKGRGRIGEALHNSKLTAGQVIAIRFMASLGRKQNVMARQYRVSQMTISRAISGEHWRHVKMQEWW